MAFMTDNAYDALLNYVRDNGGTLHICSQQPTNYTEATSTYSLGSKASPTIGAPQNAAGSGREVVVSAITDGSVTATGTASHWAIVKDSATTELLVSDALASSQVVTNGNPFTLPSFAIRVPDAVSA